MANSKSISFSVRLAPEDTEFLAGLQLPGANTPSEKLRALIEQARLREQAPANREAALRFSRQMLEPALRAVREAEFATDQQSELMNQLGQSLASILAELLADRPSLQADVDQQAKMLRTLEAELTGQVLKLFERILRLGLTQPAPCYDGNLLANKLQPILQLATIIKKENPNG